MVSVVSDKEIGLMLMGKAAGLTNEEIGQRVGFSSSTVSEYTNMVEDRVRDGENYDDVVKEYVLADVYDSEFRREMAKVL